MISAFRLLISTVLNSISHPVRGTTILTDRNLICSVTSSQPIKIPTRLIHSHESHKTYLLCREQTKLRSSVLSPQVTRISSPNLHLNRARNSALIQSIGVISATVRVYSTGNHLDMADDASYNTFLTRANQDVSSGGSNKPDSTSQARSQFDPSVSSSGYPASLSQISTTYTSDTDSEFEPIFFNYAAEHLPDVKEFTKCLGTKGQEGSVEELSVQSWDPNGKYGDVVEKVKQAGNGQGIKVFRVEVDSTRVEYYVVTVGERKLVGVIAKAVES